MDLPEGTAQAITYTLSPEAYGGGSSGSGPATGWGARLAAWQQQLQWANRVAGSSVRSFAESFWQQWGAECTMLLLLAAALLASNAVSLLLLVLVALGMAGNAAQPSSHNGPRASAAASIQGSRRFSTGNSSTGTGAEGRRLHPAVSWWWWHLVLGVLVVVLVSRVLVLNAAVLVMTSAATHNAAQGMHAGNLEMRFAILVACFTPLSRHAPALHVSTTLRKVWFTQPRCCTCR